MKIIILRIICFFVIAVSANAQQTILNIFKNINNGNSMSSYLKTGLSNLGLSIDNEIPEYNLTVIHYILKNTYENNIHKMRGETENKVYTDKNGREAVFDKNGNLVTNGWNRGSYNFGSYDKPIQKFLLDILPWLVWGNTKNDPTTFEERLFYYCADLNNGIQSYIFIEDKNELEKIKYSELKKDEKEVYHFFNYLLFNEKYEITLEEKDLANLQKDDTIYLQYFNQIMNVTGFKL